MERLRDIFAGAKVMVFTGPHLIALWRDETPGIVFPGCLDFPGGGREGGESPETCAIREAEEEIGLKLRVADLTLVHVREHGDQISWFFAAHLPEASLKKVVFGDEGAGWQAMPPDEFVTHPKAIPHFAEILSTYLKDGAPLGPSN
ncbi:NUDIX domain-containing protein [uncultured Pelagimonas sp.]|uniref:NUDIX domain-containing protein n=1 Tax=uncultured Pelagimonas sp. TaxID=1618102 RepID=UPI002611B672|nr:NUDIX domain-containing protein [uncultured Pelagimonas sp.]